MRLEAGEAFDVAVLTSDAIADLVKDGKVGTASRAELARLSLPTISTQDSVNPMTCLPTSMFRSLPLCPEQITEGSRHEGRNYEYRCPGHSRLDE